MGITYCESLPDKMAYFQLFESSGWNARYEFAPDELQAAVARSWYLVNAYDGETLVGSGRAISDGVSHALIVDVIVLPAYQRQGIGGTIMARLIAHCCAHQIRDTQLFCARGKEPFYEKLGFRPRTAEAPGMELLEVGEALAT